MARIKFYNNKTQAWEYADVIYGSGSVSNVDLSNYATKEYVDNAIDNIEVPETNVDLSSYALKSEIPDVSGYQTEAQVIALINANMPASGDEVSY